MRRVCGMPPSGKFMMACYPMLCHVVLCCVVACRAEPPRGVPSSSTAYQAGRPPAPPPKAPSPRREGGFGGGSEVVLSDIGSGGLTVVVATCNEPRCLLRTKTVGGRKCTRSDLTLLRILLTLVFGLATWSSAPCGKGSVRAAGAMRCSRGVGSLARYSSRVPLQ